MELHYYGEVVSETGLKPVAQALADCSWRIELRSSGFDGTWYLRTPHTQKEIELDMDSGQSCRFLFGGVVEGTTERALSLLGDFSRCLAVADFPHRVEICDLAREDVGYLNHKWPPGQDEPID